MSKATDKDWSFDFESDSGSDLDDTTRLATTYASDTSDSPDWSFDFEGESDETMMADFTSGSLADDSDSMDWSFDFEADSGVEDLEDSVMTATSLES